MFYSLNNYSLQNFKIVEIPKYNFVLIKFWTTEPHPVLLSLLGFQIFPKFCPFMDLCEEMKEICSLSCHQANSVLAGRSEVLSRKPRLSYQSSLGHEGIRLCHSIVQEPVLMAGDCRELLWGFLFLYLKYVFLSTEFVERILIVVIINVLPADVTLSWTSPFCPHTNSVDNPSLFSEPAARPHEPSCLFTAVLDSSFFTACLNRASTPSWYLFCPQHGAAMSP